MKITAAQCRAARGLLNISQAELAERAGMSKQALSLFEVGKTAPMQANMRGIVAALTDAGIRFMTIADGVPVVGVYLIRGGAGEVTGKSSAEARSG